jgi:PAS domain S-box-containing protein
VSPQDKPRAAPDQAAVSGTKAQAAVPLDRGLLGALARALATADDLTTWRATVAEYAQQLVGAVEVTLFLETRPLAVGGGGHQLFVPLRFENNALGTLGVKRPDSAQAFTPEEADNLALLADLATVALVHIRREQAAHQRANWRVQAMELLHEAVRAMGSTLEPVPLMRRSLKATTRMLSAEAGILALLEDHGDLVVRAVEGTAPRDLLGQRVKPASNVMGWAIRHRRVALIPDPSADPRVRDAHVLAQAGIPVRTLLTAPLVIKGRVIGAIEVANKRTGAFDQSDLHLLEVAAGSTAVATENARLYERLTRQMLQQENIIHVSQATSSAEQVETVLEKVVSATLSSIPKALTAAVHLIGDEHDALELKCYGGRPLWDRREEPFFVGQGIAGQVFATRQVVNLADVSRTPDYLPGPGPTIYASLMVAPLIAEEQPLGTLSVNGLEPGTFDADDEQMLYALAAQTAVALRDARLVNSLRDSEARYRGLVENVEALLITADATGTILFAAGRWEEMTGYPAEEVIGLSCTELCHPEDQPVMERVVGELAAGASRTTGVRYRMRHRDGTYRWHQVNAISYSGPGGEVERIYAVAQDVSSQVKAERAINRHTEQLAALNAIAAHITSSLDLDEIITQGLHKLHDILGVAAVGVALFDREHGVWRPHTVLGMASDLLNYSFPMQTARNSSLVRQQQPVLISDLDQRPVLEKYPGLQEMILREGIRSAAAVPVIAKGEVIGALVVASKHPDTFSPDVVELLSSIGRQFGIAAYNARLYDQAEERATELEAAYRELRTLARRKNQFVQNTSHELRTPLTLLCGYLELLLEGSFGAMSEEQTDVLQTVNRKSQQLVELVDDISSLIEIELDPEDVEEVNLARVVDLSLTLMRHRLEQSTVRIKAEWASVPLLVKGHRHRLGQVFNHLLDNAIKFSPSGGEIHIRLWADEDHALVEVSDQGIGIPPEEQGHIFDRFYQVDGSTTRRFGGTGLGLAIVKETVEAHGGTVQVQSSGIGGQGTTFTVILPKLD